MGPWSRRGPTPSNISQRVEFCVRETLVSNWKVRIGGGEKGGGSKCSISQVVSVTSPQLSGCGRLRPVCVLSRGLLFVYFAAFRSCQRGSLEVERLIFGRDASVADAHILHSTGRQVYRDTDYRTGCETLLSSKQSCCEAISSLS